MLNYISTETMMDIELEISELFKKLYGDTALVELHIYGIEQFPKAHAEPYCKILYDHRDNTTMIRER